MLFKTIFWTFSNLGFPGICSRNLSVSFFIRPSAPITTGKVLVFRCHIFSTSISKSLYLESFSNTFAETFLSEGILMSINRQVLFALFLMTISGRFACIVRSV